MYNSMNAAPPPGLLPDLHGLLDPMFVFVGLQSPSNPRLFLLQWCDTADFKLSRSAFSFRVLASRPSVSFSQLRTTDEDTSANFR